MNDECPICMNNLTGDVLTGPCFHRMCKKCAMEWLWMQPKCPICNHHFTLDQGVQRYIPAKNARWESRDPQTGEWVRYSTAHTAELEAALHNGEGQCVILLGYRKYIVVFKSLRQINHEGGSRAVRRLVDPRPRHFEWQSQDPETGTWLAYSQDINQQLEGAFDMGNKECEIYLMNSRRYVVALPSVSDQLGSQINTESGRRAVRRHNIAVKMPRSKLFKPKTKGFWARHPPSFLPFGKVTSC